MGEYNLGKTTKGDAYNAVDPVTVAHRTTDGPTGSKETEFIHTDFPKWYGYYKKIPELKQVIDLRAAWVIGAGYTTSTRDQVILDRINGYGNDTFTEILKNMLITRRIAGDAFSEIVRDKQGALINVKPLDPSSIKIVVDKKGLIKRYEQVEKTNGEAVHKFKPLEIFHLTNKRTADEIHGASDVEAVEAVINAMNESFKIGTQIVRHFARPKIMCELDTDDQTKIDNFITKFDEATNKGNNLFYPKDTVNPEVLDMPGNAVASLLSWKAHLKEYFFQVVNLPQILTGFTGASTESNGKVAMTAFQQSVKDEQQDLKEQIWKQLFIKIEPGEAVSLLPNLQADQSKDGVMGQMDIQPSEMQPPRPEVVE